MTTKIYDNQIKDSILLTGTPTASTPSVSDDSTRIATTEFVHNVFDEFEVSNALNAPYELVQALGSLTTNTTIDCADGNIATCTIGGALSFTFTASCAAGYCRTLTLIITNGGAYTITWPTAVKWAGGSAPTFTASGVDIVTLITVDAGTTWYGSANGVSYA